MSDMDKKNMQEAGPPDYYVEGVYESPFKSVFLVIWRYRGVFIILTGLVTILVLALAGWKYSGQVKENITQLTFMIHFEGIEDNQYPNGLKFTLPDITAPGILYKVYTENHLDKYMEFVQFSKLFFVLQKNDQITLLEAEYSEKLRDNKLKAPERKKIEEEFIAKKSELLIPVYQLILTSFPGMKAIPFELRAKILNNILENWAEFILTTKGVDRYQIDLVSTNILNPEDLKAEDYFINSDMLRMAIGRVMTDVMKVENLPGAKLVTAGPEKVSLQDIRFHLEDLLEFKLNTLVGLIHQVGATKNRQQTLSYLQNRIFNKKLETGEAGAVKEVYKNSLDQYMRRQFREVSVSLSGEIVESTQPRSIGAGNMPAMIPQFGDSLFTNLMTLVRDNSDMEYRQSITNKIISAGLKEVKLERDLQYYNQMYEIIKKPVKDQPGEINSSDLELIEKGHKIIYQEIIQAINDLNVIYLEVCRNNLDPGSQVYTLSGPILSKTVSSLSLKKLILYAVFSWIILEVLLILGIYLKNLTSDKEHRTSGRAS